MPSILQTWCGTCSASPCAAPPPCPTITSVDCRVRMASKTKCGFSEFGTPSSPPKKYLTFTQSGSIGITDGMGNSSTSTLSGAGNYVTDVCSYSEFGGVVTTMNNGCTYGDGGGLLSPSSGIQISWATDPVTCFTAAVCLGVGADWIINSTTSATFPGTVCSLSGYTGSGSYSLALSNEYTTATLYTDTSNALNGASYSGYSSSCAGSEYVLSTDELTITLSQTQYRATFSGPVPSGTTIGWSIYTNGGLSGAGGGGVLAGATTYSVTAPVPTTPGQVITLGNFALTCP